MSFYGKIGEILTDFSTDEKIALCDVYTVEMKLTGAGFNHRCKWGRRSATFWRSSWRGVPTVPLFGSRFWRENQKTPRNSKKLGRRFKKLKKISSGQRGVATARQQPVTPMGLIDIIFVLFDIDLRFFDLHKVKDGG